MSHMSDTRVIGSWSFHVPSSSPDPQDRLATMVGATTATSEMLTQAQLLREATVRFTGWLTWVNSAPRLDEAIDDLIVDNIARIASPQLLQDIHAHAASQGAPGAQPSRCEVAGDGVLLTPGGSESGRLVGVTLVDDGVGATVTVNTYSTAWMRFAPDGAEQPELADLNSPRLALALARLADALGSEVDPQPPTIFAIPTDTGLDNHRDSDGDIANLSSD